MASVVPNYARAFADVVVRAKMDVDQATAELQQFVAVLQQVPQLKQVLESPAVQAEQRLELLDSIGRHFGSSRQLRNFIAVLIDHRRLSLLPEIVSQFRAEINQRLGLAEALVTSARALGEEERREIEKQVAQVTGKKVATTYAQDAALLGGAVIRIGSTVYDGSVRAQLARVRAQMAGE